MGFEKEVDARQMSVALKERLAKFGLLLHEDETRLIEFGRFAALTRKTRGERSEAMLNRGSPNGLFHHP